MESYLNITRGQAIEKIIDLLIHKSSIPMCSIEENNGSVISWIDPEDINLANFLTALYDAEEYDVVPIDEIAEDFEYSGIHLEDYDVCVEFKSNTKKNPYREQYLLWGFM